MVRVENVDIYLGMNLNVDTGIIYFETDIDNPYTAFPSERLGTEWSSYLQTKQNKQKPKYGGKRYKLIY